MQLRISFRELEVFVAICEQLTVTRAASVLSMTQSAASQSLSALESALGTVLFDRVGRRLVSNEHGRLLLPRARAILDLGLDAQNLFLRSAALLRLGASTTIANYLLPQRIAGFRSQNPETGIELMVGNTQETIAAVATFQVDVGFIEGPCHHPELRIEPWMEDELLVVVAANHPFAEGEPGLEQLAASSWILREAGSGTRQEVDRLLLPAIGMFSAVMELGDSEAIKYAVEAGLGISCLPRRVVAAQLKQGSLHALSLPRLSRTLSRIMHRDKVMTRGMSDFLAYVDQNA